jgi:prepilin-type N-terminal cleavage/methylation domain-containing protein
MRGDVPRHRLVQAVVNYRRGFSLAELVVVTALAGLVGSMIAVTLTRQQRFFRGAAELHYVRENVRDALEMLSTDIRGMSASDTVRLRADSAIEFFANIGSSVVCRIDGNEVGLPSAHTSANSLSAFVSEPDTGDLAVFYLRSESDTESWERHRIAGFGSRTLASSCPTASGISQQSEIDAGGRGFIVTVATPLGGDVTVGSPVRFVRRGRYSLYNASDGDWYLGYRRCNAIEALGCGAIQPVSGPYRPYSSDPRSTGLLFEYFDGTGQSLGPAATPLALARVDLTARSESAHQLVFGTRSNRISDSATVSLAIRNVAR